MYGNMVDENLMYQQLQKICRGSLYKKVFRANLGKSGKNILRTPKQIACSYTYDEGVWGTKNFRICCAACANGVHLF